MSKWGKRKNKERKEKEAAETRYTIENLIDDEVEKFGAFLQSVIDAANEKGQHGVMVVATETAYECDLVPYGKVYHAKSQRVVDNMRASLGKED